MNPDGAAGRRGRGHGEGVAYQRIDEKVFEPRGSWMEAGTMVVPYEGGTSIIVEKGCSTLITLARKLQTSWVDGCHGQQCLIWRHDTAARDMAARNCERRLSESAWCVCVCACMRACVHLYI
jgi:hypothetical protein